MTVTEPGHGDVSQGARPWHSGKGERNSTATGARSCLDRDTVKLSARIARGQNEGNTLSWAASALHRSGAC